MSITAGLRVVGGVPATLVAASETLDWLIRLKTESLMLYWVLSVDERSRLSMGVLERMGVDGLIASGSRDPDLRDRSWKPARSGLELLAGMAPGDGDGMSESRRGGAANATAWGTTAPLAAWE